MVSTQWESFKRDGTLECPVKVRIRRPVAASQSLSVASKLPSKLPPENTRRPSGEKATDFTPSECPVKVRIRRPVAASQSLSVPSKLPPENTRRPSGEKATDRTPSECPVKVRIGRPVAASQSLSVPSSLPESTRRSSGEKATDCTPPKCPVKVRIRRPVAASQSLSDLSQLPESTRRPSGEKATESTLYECPVKVRIRRPVAASQSLSDLSQLPESTRRPSGEKATDATRLECPIWMSTCGAAIATVEAGAEATCDPRASVACAGPGAVDHATATTPARIVRMTPFCRLMHALARWLSNPMVGPSTLPGVSRSPFPGLPPVTNDGSTKWSSATDAALIRYTAPRSPLLIESIR